MRKVFGEWISDFCLCSAERGRRDDRRRETDRSLHDNVLRSRSHRYCHCRHNPGAGSHRDGAGLPQATSVCLSVCLFVFLFLSLSLSVSLPQPAVAWRTPNPWRGAQHRPVTNQQRVQTAGITRSRHRPRRFLVGTGTLRAPRTTKQDRFRRRHRSVRVRQGQSVIS